jgi:hypothetical protein
MIIRKLHFEGLSVPGMLRLVAISDQCFGGALCLGVCVSVEVYSCNNLES